MAGGGYPVTVVASGGSPVTPVGLEASMVVDDSGASVQDVLGQSITFEATPVSVFGRNLYRSVETFDLAVGNRIEVDTRLWMDGDTNANGVWVGDGTKAIYNVREAAGTGYTLGRYSAGDSSLGLTRTAGAMAGLNQVGVTVVPRTGGAQAVAQVEGTPLAGAAAFGNTSNVVNTAPVHVYVLADDIAKSSARVKLITP